MLIICPHCGEAITAGGLGRKAFNMPVMKVCNTLRLCRSVPLAAEKLGCSRAYIYKVLKANGMTTAEVMKGSKTVDRCIN